MDKFVIEGGRALRGKVRVSGSKNAVLPVLAASLLTEEPLRVPNAPRLSDLDSMLEVLRSLGSRAEFDHSRTEAIESVGPAAREHPLAFQRAEQAQRRALGQVKGAREIREPPFGCLIGERPEHRKRPSYGLGPTQRPA